jgi:hypothetical protein
VFSLRSVPRLYKQSIVRHAIYVCHRFRPRDAHLTLNGRNILFVSYIKYLGVIFDERITWRLHIEMIEDKVSRTFTRTWSLFKSERLSANTKLTLYKALIRSVMTYVCPPGNLQETLTSSNCSTLKTRSARYLKFSKVHTSPWFAHSFQSFVFIWLCNKVLQATSRSHTKSWEWACSQYRTRRSQT